MGTRGTLARMPAAAVAGLLFVLGPAGGPPATAAGRGPGSPAVPSPGVSSVLQDVACTSASNCWAVGSYEAQTAQLNEALHWNGSSWAKAGTPDHGTGPGDHSSLSAVACTSASNCWAVGSYDSGAGQLNEALHWNGSSWSRIATPDPGLAGSGVRALNGVSCVSRTDCWAVGAHISDRGISRNAVLQWNGASWSAVSAPNPGGNAAGNVRELSGVACVTASDCWAVGGFVSKAGTERGEVLRWNGTQWLRAAMPGNGALSGVACRGAANCWAVQGQASGTGAVQWNGASWSAAATPGDAQLNGVACAAAASCLAVGNDASSVAQLNDVLRWNGTSWSAVAVSDPGGTAAGAHNRLAAVSCTSARMCWAVGSYWDMSIGAHRNVVLGWNGRSWSS